MLGAEHLQRGGYRARRATTCPQPMVLAPAVSKCTPRVLWSQEHGMPSISVHPKIGTEAFQDAPARLGASSALASAGNARQQGQGERQPWAKPSSVGAACAAGRCRRKTGSGAAPSGATITQNGLRAGGTGCQDRFAGARPARPGGTCISARRRYWPAPARCGRIGPSSGALSSSTRPYVAGASALLVLSRARRRRRPPSSRKIASRGDKHARGLTPLRIGAVKTRPCWGRPARFRVLRSRDRIHSLP